MADVHVETRGKYFIFRNEPIASGPRFGDSMNAGRPMKLGARTRAVAAALFFLVVDAALGQQDATTPTQTEKELEIKKKEVKQTELDLQKKRAALEKLKVALKYQETAHAININLQADVLLGHLLSGLKAAASCFSTVIWTRRFCARPSGLSLPSGFMFGATGFSSPKPSVVMFLAGRPLFFTNHRFTATARSFESARFLFWLPIESV